MMKRLQSYWQAGLGAAAVAALAAGCGQGPFADSQVQLDFQSQLRLEDEARAKDPAWKPSHREVAIIKVGRESGATLNNFCLDRSGNILACLQGQATGRHSVEVYSPDGKRTKSWPVEAAPEAICLDQDGSVLVAGSGRIQRFDSEGKVLATAKTPATDAPLAPEEDLKELAKRFGEGSTEARLKRLQEALASRRLNVTGLGVAGNDVFLACPSTKDWTYCVYRLDKNFQNPKLIVEKLGGCCSQMDIQAGDGKVWVAHNGRHRVECHDRDGKLLSSFGKEDRKAADGFGGCCEPKNLRLRPGGEMLAAESGPPVAIKRFTAEGKFLGVVALPTFKLGCVRTTVDVSPDGKRYYVLNGEERAIHVFAVQN
jgi:hypothetical protein